MALHDENLFTLIGRVERARPGMGQSLYEAHINDAIRMVINKRNYWSDLRKSGIIAVPDQYNTGTISTVNGQSAVIGTATLWPINDAVSTVTTSEVDGLGFNFVNLASMAGVTRDSILLIDAGTPKQEAVAVVKLSDSGFTAKFQFLHPTGATVTQSSLVGRQFRTGFNHPIFTVTAVVDAQTLLIDNAWGGPGLTNVQYYILKMYFTIDPMVRKLIAVVDQQQGIPLDTDKTQEELNWWDPQRTDNSDPQCFASLGPNASGNMLYEIWPAPTSARQIAFLATLQWPALKDNEDIPPPFLEPTMFTNFATAVALRTRISRDDVFFDPKLAVEYERMAKEQMQDAIDSDEQRALQDYRTQIQNLIPNGGADYWRQHDPLVMSGMF